MIKVISEGDKVGDITFSLASIIENKEMKFDSTPRLYDTILLYILIAYSHKNLSY